MTFYLGNRAHLRTLFTLDYLSSKKVEEGIFTIKKMKMYRWFLVPWIILLFLFTVFPLSLAQENLPEIVKKIEPSVVVITTYDKEGKILGQGSGFFISNDGDVITNRHVLQGANRVEVKTSEGKRYSITRVLAEDKEGDLIRVSVDISTSAVKPLGVTRSLPKVGEQVVVIGNPLGLERTVSDGIVSAVREIPEFGKIIQITAPVSSGSSGSPVLNMKGEVIGVATFLMLEGQNLNFAIPAERVAKLTPGEGQTLAEWQAGRTKEWLTSAEGLYSCGLFFLWVENYEKALPYFEEATKKNPRYAQAYFAVGYCYGRLGRYTEAIESYKQAIRIQPDYAEAHCNLGLAYAILGRYNEAIESFKQAIRIQPDDAGAHFHLGNAYANLKRYTEEIEAYKEAIRIQPDFAEVHLCLGLAYLSLNDKSSALDQYKILKNLDKDLANELFNLIYK